MIGNGSMITSYFLHLHQTIIPQTGCSFQTKMPYPGHKKGSPIFKQGCHLHAIITSKNRPVVK
jgi:hypothetical protein